MILHTWYAERWILSSGNIEEPRSTDMKVQRELLNDDDAVDMMFDVAAYAYANRLCDACLLAHALLTALRNLRHEAVLQLCCRHSFSARRYMCLAKFYSPVFGLGFASA